MLWLFKPYVFCFLLAFYVVLWACQYCLEAAVFQDCFIIFEGVSIKLLSLKNCQEICYWWCVVGRYVYGKWFGNSLSLCRYVPYLRMNVEFRKSNSFTLVLLSVKKPIFLKVLLLFWFCLYFLWYTFLNSLDRPACWDL